MSNGYTNYYFVSMEGLTEDIYRNAHNKFFNNIDKYFASNKNFNKKQNSNE